MKYLGVLSVLYDESGHTKFPFSYVFYVTFLTPAQALLRIRSGFTQTSSA